MTVPLTSTVPAAPAWTAVDWRRHEHDRSISGRRVRYVDYGSGSPLLLLHGLGCCWQWWLENLPTLGLTRRVVAVDLPGFGHSEPLPASATMAEYAAVMSELCRVLGLEHVTVTGHSMGGLVALAMAEREPALVARVILVNAGGVPMSEARLSAVIGVIRAIHATVLRPGVLRALARRPRLRRTLSRLATSDPEALRPELAVQVIPLMAAPGFVDAVIASGRAVRETHPEGVGCPVLLLWGERDPIVPVHTARAMAARLPDPQLVLVPGAGHTPMLEAPAIFNRHVLAFTEDDL